MLTLIHGDDIALSRNFFIEQKRNTPNPVTFDGESVTMTDITQVLAGGNLFGSDQSLFLENLLSKRRKSTEKEALIEYLLSKHDAPIFLWEEQELDKRTLTQFKNSQIHLFALPKSLFTFLEGIQPGNGRRLIKLFHESLPGREPEIVVFMLARQIRLLLALAYPGEKIIAEVKRLAPWQQLKLQKQAKTFTKEQLLEIHRQLFRLDLKQKTGSLPADLTSTIDFFLLEI